MTREVAEEIIKRHKREKYFSVSRLQCGRVEVLKVFENGFTYRRTTDYIESFGIYEEYQSVQYPGDLGVFNISEVVMRRF